MSVSSDDAGEDESWKVDLEIALLEDADFFRVRSICKNRPVPQSSRAEVWRICLQPELQAQAMANFNDVFGLKNQEQLHADCEKAAEEVAAVLLSNQKASNQAAPTHDDDELDGDDDDEINKFDLDTEQDPSSQTPVQSVAQITSDFESVLTHFAQTYSLPYCASNGWIPIIKTLYTVLRPFDRQDLYACFASVCHRFVPTGGSDADARICVIFRLLLQYHEPKLCSLLDSLKISPDVYAGSWLISLFANIISHEVLVCLWDIYFLISDPLLGMFITLVLLINAKVVLIEDEESAVGQDGDTKDGEKGCVNQKVEDMEESRNVLVPGPKVVCKVSNPEEVRKILLDLPKPMQIADVNSLIELTQLFSNRTPSSFRAQYLPVLFGNADLKSADHLLTGTLCMPVSVQEVLEAQASALRNATRPTDPVECLDESASDIRFLLVDCRPADQYNAGHLNTAFFLDSQLILSEPSDFKVTVEALLQSQQRAIAAGSYAAGEHITFLSSGRPEEDRITNMVVAAFLRLNTPFVSLIEGGYAALHDALGPEAVARRLASHDPKECLCCRSRAVPLNESRLRPVSVMPFRRDPNKASSLVTTKDNKNAKPSEGLLSKFSASLFGTRPSTGHEIRADVKKPSGPAPKHQDAQKSPPSGVPAKNAANIDVKMATVATESHRTSNSYRNTSSVFSIDDDLDDDELPQPAEAVVEKDVSPPIQTKTERKDSSQRSSWFKRLTTSNGTQEDLPQGDIPTRAGGLDCGEPGDLVDTTQWSCRPEVRGVFDCQLVNQSGRLSELGYLVLVDRHLLLLRDYSPRSAVNLIASIGSVIQTAITKAPPPKPLNRPRHAVVMRSVPLRLITRITANRRLPECITFHYSGGDATELLLLNEQVMGLRDRLFIPKAGEAVRMIKMSICNVTLP
ncbi:unnamed protein product [Calicophoron daubneyi]|uniref:TBC1 domain family member 23 n=1 Tax=Calicophoron daubneyi TaxID=300641 RepID=A0AAV2TJ46_CALDB